MPVIARGFDDILLDRIVDALDDFRNEQVAMDASVGFDVERDRSLPMGLLHLPLVNTWADSIQPESGSTRKYGPMTVRINVDCYTCGVMAGDTDTDEVDKAISRLYYLKAQVLHALYDLVNVDFGFPVGTIAKKTWPTWAPMKGPDNMPETLAVAGRWSFDVTFAYMAEDIPGIALDEIAVNAGLWSGLYQYGED
jgi:hypothetical protein